MATPYSDPNPSNPFAPKGGYKLPTIAPYSGPYVPPEYVSEGAPTTTYVAPKPTGQPGAWSTSYGTASQAGKAKLVAAQNKAQQEKKKQGGTGSTGKAGSTGKTGAASPGTATPKSLSELLNIDVTGAYAPQLSYLETLQQKEQERYAQNKANISNLFGALTSLGAKDTAAINKQFTDSIAAQQLNLSNRTAEAKAGQTAGEAQVAATGAERGTGPAMAGSPTATATAEGIAASNAYQTQWEGLQNAMQNQAVIDIANRQAGYGQQEIGAIQQLQQNLDARLLELAGQSAGVAGDIAKAKLGVQQNIAQAKYGEAIDARDYARQQAAAAAAAANSAARAAAKPKRYDSSIGGWTSKITDAGGSSDAIINSVNDAIAAVKAAKKTAASAPGSKVKSTKVTTADVIAKWTKDNGGTAATPYAIEYINKYSGLGK